MRSSFRPITIRSVATTHGVQPRLLPARYKDDGAIGEATARCSLELRLWRRMLEHRLAIRRIAIYALDFAVSPLQVRWLRVASSFAWLGGRSGRIRREIIVLGLVAAWDYRVEGYGLWYCGHWLFIQVRLYMLDVFPPFLLVPAARCARSVAILFTNIIAIASNYRLRSHVFMVDQQYMMNVAGRFGFGFDWGDGRCSSIKGPERGVFVARSRYGNRMSSRVQMSSRRSSQVGTTNSTSANS